MNIKPVTPIQSENAALGDEMPLLNSNLDTIAGELGAEAEAAELLDVVRDFLALMGLLDSRLGVDGVVLGAEAGLAADHALLCLGELDAVLGRRNLSHLKSVLHTLTLGIGLWALRHRCDISTLEPIANALAERANDATSRQEVAAAYGMMQGFIDYLQPRQDAAKDRSDPMRPWRLLNLNFAISGIRSGDELLMRFAFDRLNANLPEDCADFYADALLMAEESGLPEEIVSLIRTQAHTWTSAHQTGDNAGLSGS